MSAPIAPERAPLVNDDRFHGRNRIASRAIRAVVSAVAATELGAPAKAVGVQLDDDNGALAVTVSAPIGIPSLLGAQPAWGSTASVLDRAGAARDTIRTRVHELTGSQISTVNVRLTAARIAEEERVR